MSQVRAISEAMEKLRAERFATRNYYDIYGIMPWGERVYMFTWPDSAGVGIANARQNACGTFDAYEAVLVLN